MSLANLVISSVARAKAELGDLLIEFVLRKKTGTSYVNGKYVNTYSDHGIFGCYDKFEVHEIDGDLIKTTDVKILLFVASTLPENGDLLSDEGGSQVYNVVRADNTYAGSTAVISSVQVRK